MTSLEIAQVTGKMHKDVMKAIRNMEPAWEQERGRKFALTQIREEIPNGGYRLRPVFVLSKTECLYVATKFNDVARAKLVLRWEELERENALNDKGKMMYLEIMEELKSSKIEELKSSKIEELKPLSLFIDTADVPLTRYIGGILLCH